MKSLPKYLNTKSKWHPEPISDYCIVVPFDGLYNVLGVHEEENIVGIDGSEDYRFNIWVLKKDIVKEWIEWADKHNFKYYLYEIPEDCIDLQRFKKDYSLGKYFPDENYDFSKTFKKIDPKLL